MTRDGMDRDAGAARRHDLARIAAGYGIAAGAAAACVLFIDVHPLLAILIADVVATVIVFAASVLYRNSSWYDAYWSVAPLLIALWLISLDGPAPTAREVLVMIPLTLWSVRLTVNWAWGWRGMAHEDWRYQALQASSGRLWWPLSFLGVHLFPTLVVYVGCIALYPALVIGSAPLSTLDAVALTLGLGAVWLEFEADRQLHRFRARRGSSAELLTTGVWAWCRHPNYLGEIGFWVSLFLFGWAGFGAVYPGSWLGPVTMLMLFSAVSIPMIERRLRTDKPGYADYCARTRALLPVARRG